MLGVFYLQTYYSIMSSTYSIESLIKKAIKNNYDFVALSEEENLYSMVDFLELCNKYKIKPIMGIKIYLYLDFLSSSQKIGFLVYSFDDIGLQNLIKISNFIKIKRNHITLKELLFFQEGNFFILSNIEFVFINLLDTEIIKKILFKLKSEIKYFFLGISLQSNFLEMFANIFFSLAEKLNLQVVAVHKTHFLEEEEKDIYELLLKLSNKKINKKFNFQFLEKEKIIKDYQVYFNDYKHLFLDLKKFMENIQYQTIFNNIIYSLPSLKLFDIYENSYQCLRKIVFDNLFKKISQKSINFALYLERLEKELNIIKKISYEKYFLIVYDLISYAKKKKILLGPGRGSSSSSLVCFLLGITEVDPLLYNLIFERFLNLYRNKMPDIDLDFPDNKLNIILKYIVKKYGINHVANIITFSTLTVKSILNNITYMNYKISNNEIKKLNKLEGIPKFIGTHPAGIIISKNNLLKFLPIQKNIQINSPFLYQTQLDAKQLAKMGFNKIDLLSLKSLTFIEKILQKISKKFRISWNQIPLDDLDTFSTLQKGDTEYIFQLESPNAQNILKKVCPKKIEDLVDVLALNRPGPFFFLNNYLKYKDRKSTKIIDESIDFIIKKTNGIILYQEQIMEIAFYFAGYNLSESENFMNSITRNKLKKDNNDFIQIKENFLHKSQKKGNSLYLSNKIYNYIIQFSNYTFNKSHSVAYSLISYRMTYLKTHYFLFFFAVLLDEYVKNSLITFQIIKKIKKKKNIIFVKPSVFESTSEYQILDDNKVLLPLTLIKDLSFQICELIIKEREKRKFYDFYDFLTRCKYFLNNSLLRNLIFAGSLDFFGLKRKTLFQNSNLDFLEHEKYLTPFKKKIEKETEYSLEYLKKENIKIFGFFLNELIF
ncbi:DNA polymerase III, alpha subunit [Candidatus Phytoplasma oryzae]|uniref:DNA-directed DNA polymerase n=1 Tax=Candidatus Phytoplasma oryzae TaxID=203274 RepID=A0A139JQX7_9MOLU|nr:PHP domain-containing protein [Candidatus Phytoplasma oryzae]KXT29276.1 DNA polymerase III, alpha subunit [Candidatus Phytoplasma oryzae]RAM57859.1 hypothetical protein DH96_00845 [Candidatus Phytoplasma oryzae]